MLYFLSFTVVIGVVGAENVGSRLRRDNIIINDILSDGKLHKHLHKIFYQKQILVPSVLLKIIINLMDHELCFARNLRKTGRLSFFTICRNLWSWQKPSLSNLRTLPQTYHIYDCDHIEYKSKVSDSLSPYFPSIVENVTVSYGRKAVLKCEVENLRNYKVRPSLSVHVSPRLCPREAPCLGRHRDKWLLSSCPRGHLGQSKSMLSPPESCSAPAMRSDNS